LENYIALEIPPIVIIVLGFCPMKRKIMNSSHKELFRLPTVIDKLAFFRSLLDDEEMHADLALALLKMTHQDLSKKQTSERSAYRRYAETVASLRHRKADMLRQVVTAWQDGQRSIPPEWFSSAASDD
jgi:hypothetical protein